MNNEKIHSVKYNFLMNLILTSTQFLFPLITFPYISRVLLAAGTGKVSFAMSIANYFLMVASLGIPTYGVRACAQVRDDKDKLSKVAQEIFIINLFMTILVMMTYIICISCIPRFQTDKVLFQINGLNILLNMFGMNWLFQAVEQYDYITARSIAFKVLSVLLMFLLVHAESDYIVYSAITVFAAVGSNILNFIKSKSIINFHWYGNYSIKQHMKPIFILFAQSLAISIYTNLDTVMLGFMRTDVDVGLYNAAIKVKSVLTSVVTSLGTVLLPRMSYYLKQQRRNDFSNTVVKALNFTVSISLPLSVIFFVLAKDTMLFLAGKEFEGAIAALQISVIAIIPIGITNILGIQVLTASEKEKYVLFSVSLGAAVDFLLNMLLIPTHGSTGAALATTIAEFVVLAYQIWVTRKLLSEIKVALRWKSYMLVSGMAGIALYFIANKFVATSFVRLFFLGIAYMLLYFIGLLMTKDPYIKNTLGTVHNILKHSSSNSHTA